MVLSLGIILAVAMLLIGGERGYKSLLTVIYNVLALVIYIYLLYKGVPPFLITLICSLFLIFMILFFQNGWNSKTCVCAVTALVVVVFLMGFIGLIVRNTRISGFSEVELALEISTEVSSDVALNMEHIMIGILVLGVLGAILDTAMAIATALYEIASNNPTLGFRKLIHAGNNVGRDILGTTVNTLVFAGMGEGIMIFLLFIGYGYTLDLLMNSDEFFKNLFMILIANVGCLLIIPLTDLCMSFYLSQRKEKKKVKK